MKQKQTSVLDLSFAPCRLSYVGRQQHCEQSGSTSNIGDEDVLLQCMGSVASDTKAVEDWNPKCGDKISIRPAADLGLAKLVTERTSYVTGTFVKIEDGGCSFQWRS